MQLYISLPITLAILYRAHSHKSLTPVALPVAGATALLHGAYPSPLPFVLLLVFFLIGTRATKVKADIKATLTLSSTGSTGGEGPRSAIQVLANSAAASVLCLLHIWRYGTGQVEGCLGTVPTRDILLAGIIANYAAVTADTLSSELGILSSHKPRLITTLREVPPGTNGGVTGTGLFAGLAGAFVIGVVSVCFLPLCLEDGWLSLLSQKENGTGAGDVFGLVLAIASWGALGSVLDSLLGALLQASVIDKRTGKVVEGAGGTKVLVAGIDHRKGYNESAKMSRFVGSGKDILDNNQINLLMAVLMSLLGMVFAAAAWEIPIISS